MSAIPATAAECSAWMKAEREARGWSTTQLADRARAHARAEGDTMALTQQTVSGFEQPGAKRIPSWMRFVKKAFEGEASEPARVATRQWAGSNPQADLPVPQSIDGGETVQIARLDLSLPMGPGALVDDYVEEEPLTFDAGYIRSFTRTPPHRLRLATGAGDSMFPTLVPNDLVWIDTTQNELRHADRIYAASINGGAVIKRLRPMAGGRRVLVISDNKVVEPYEVDASDVVIWGRVIRYARDL